MAYVKVGFISTASSGPAFLPIEGRIISQTAASNRAYVSKSLMIELLNLRMNSAVGPFKWKQLAWAVLSGAFFILLYKVAPLTFGIGGRYHQG